MILSKANGVTAILERTQSNVHNYEVRIRDSRGELLDKRQFTHRKDAQAFARNWGQK